MEKTVIAYGNKEFIVEDMTKAQKKVLKADKPKIYEKYFPTDVETENVPVETETAPENGVTE
jgi:hypothetical protein